MKIALISCSKSKQNYLCKASEMYRPSTLFSYSYQYAKTIADKVYILSAKYGLLQEDTVIEPYNLTLKSMNLKEKYDWSEKVISQIKSQFDVMNDEFIILAGKDYYEYLLKELNHYDLPLGNRTQGVRVSYLKEIIKESNHCLLLHKLFQATQRFTFDQINQISFENGIYIVFEKGEMYGQFERIVRVGTHDSPNRLKARLKDHFARENKDGSIFRKNIGKAILNKKNDTYLDVWTIDTSKPENYLFIDKKKQLEVEADVSEYLRNSFSFTCFQVEDKDLRLRLEKGIIATLNSQSDFTASSEWLGNDSPIQKIKDNGLWLTIGVDHPPLTLVEMEFIKNSLLGSSTKDISAYSITEKILPRKNISKIHRDDDNSKITTNNIRNFIFDKLKSAKEIGLTTLDIRAGDIHSEMNLYHKQAMVCQAMNTLPTFTKYDVVYTPPSGKGSNLKFKYYL
ncbi:MAG: DUF6884 domain-containing protein [Aminipila sp.]